MKNTFRLFSILMLTASLNVFAAGPRGELQPTMATMGAQFKILNAGLLRGEAKTDQELKVASDTLVSSVADAATKAPAHLLDASGNVIAGKEADVALYDELIAKLDGEAKAVQLALNNGDRALAAQILREKIVPAMRDGHERFK